MTGAVGGAEPVFDRGDVTGIPDDDVEGGAQAVAEVDQEGRAVKSGSRRSGGYCGCSGAAKALKLDPAVDPRARRVPVRAGLVQPERGVQVGVGRQMDPRRRRRHRHPPVERGAGIGRAGQGGVGRRRRRR